MTRSTKSDADQASQINRLTEIVEANPLLTKAFAQASLLHLDAYYIGAGCIAQSVWNHMGGYPILHGIQDLDFVYFDSDLSYDKECEVIERVQSQLGDLGLAVDVKNQARVHLWYEQHFNYPIPPYCSLESAIDTWPTTATAIGLRRHINGDWNVYAPFGLDDLFARIVRANKVQITEAIYGKKALRWKAIWPELTIIPWD